MKTLANITETLSAVLDGQVEEPRAEVGAEPWRRGELGTPHRVRPALRPSSIAPGEHRAR